MSIIRFEHSGRDLWFDTAEFVFRLYNFDLLRGAWYWFVVSSANVV